MKLALRARDADRLGTIRLLQAALKQREIDERITLSDGDIMAVIEKMLKQRRDSVAAFQIAKRADLVAKEEQEIAVLTAYLPQPLSGAEIHALIEQAIVSSGAKDIKAMSQVMALLKPLLLGRADMSQVSQDVKQRLGTA